MAQPYGYTNYAARRGGGAGFPPQGGQPLGGIEDPYPSRYNEPMMEPGMEGEQEEAETEDLQSAILQLLRRERMLRGR